MQWIKFIALFIGIWYTCINMARSLSKNDISGISLFMQALGITIFVWLQWLN